MIAYLKGIVFSKNATSVILLTGGVGYRVSVPSNLILSFKIGQEAELFIHSHIREDQFSLYGFSSPEELSLFELLISVSGVGPKMAMNMISTTSPRHIKSAIAAGEPAVFTKVSGVGRKTAERLIVELKEKIGEGDFKDTHIGASKQLSESLEALVALGYSRDEAREALKKIPADVSESGQIIRAALRVLGGR